ncbi:MAG: SUMF1/EgtB/PvdO family nonheme iron enzyme [Myxococcota bacterium]
MRGSLVVVVTAGLAAGYAACGSPRTSPAPPPLASSRDGASPAGGLPSPTAASSAMVVPSAAAAPKASATAPGRPSRGPPAPSPPALNPSARTPLAPCPAEMAFVDVDHCPDTPSLRVNRRCVRPERGGNANNLKICLEFAEEVTCHVPRRRQRFCIDRYEYPSRKGAHPPVMVSAYDADRLCTEQGKRMCFESEWTAACEGPRELPFPYGYTRSAEMCNIDNPWIIPNLEAVHHVDDAVRGPELMRLDQSVDSGAMPTCRSEFDVYDLTGNFDEWVRTEWRRGKGRWAGLKGGAWGHVRNACRPITTSHVAHWSYYFISFRCCKDPNEEALPSLPPQAAARWIPPKASAPKHPAGRSLDRGFTPPAGAELPNRPASR